MFGWETHEILTVSLKRQSVDEGQAATESELDIRIVRDHVIDEFDHARVVRAGAIIARDNEFGE